MKRSRLMLIFLLWPGWLWAESLKVAWDPPTTYMDGTTALTVSYYVLQWGTSPGVYTAGTSLSGGLSQATVHGLDPNVTYYFGLQAVDAAGARSAVSNEITGRATLQVGLSP